MMNPGGALNYRDRMLAIGDRSLQDFLEVNARLYAIVLGLREFYSVNDPSEADLDDDLKNARTPVEGAVKWLRRVANSLARAKMDEQECVVRLTVEPKKPGHLLEKLEAGRCEPFPDALVANLKRARLRGISATAESLNGDSSLDLEITSPEQKLSTVEKPLPHVAVRLGRVSSSLSLNMRDVAGGRPIINRSPVGDWKIRARHKMDDDRAKTISHLHLDFHLAFSEG
jgi:hypothetical protein